ncbi:hypothetical protein NKH82_32840 [Mesorhizobium sp. M0915]
MSDADKRKIVASAPNTKASRKIITFTVTLPAPSRRSGAGWSCAAQ